MSLYKEAAQTNKLIDQAWDFLYRDRKQAYLHAKEALSSSANLGDATGTRAAQAFCALLESIEKPNKERLGHLENLAQACLASGDQRAFLTAKMAAIAVMCAVVYRKPQHNYVKTKFCRWWKAKTPCCAFKLIP